MSHPICHACHWRWRWSVSFGGGFYPPIVLESATSECTIIRPGHPNGSEPLSLAVPRSVHWTSKDQKNKVRKKFSGCFRISLKSPVRTRPVWISQSSGRSSIACSVCSWAEKLPSATSEIRTSSSAFSLCFPISSGEKAVRPFLWFFLLSSCYHCVWMKSETVG